jgi:4-hydroxybenzoyl-CoA thioesterase
VATFKREVLVRFAHCDRAGWVFYPRYFEMISDFVEDWFAAGLGTSAPELLRRRAILTPSVHFTADFVKPAQFGERLLFTLRVRRIGRTSCELEIDASLAGDTRMKLRQVLVLISASTGRAVAIPAQLARRMQKFVARTPGALKGAPRSPGEGARQRERGRSRRGGSAPRKRWRKGRQA